MFNKFVSVVNNINVKYMCWLVFEDPNDSTNNYCGEFPRRIHKIKKENRKNPQPHRNCTP